jgi:hypothetical protein
MRESVLMTPEAMMATGNEILGSVLQPAGFVMTPTELGRGSGGGFAIARWVRGRQYIELHCRFALGIVRYGWEDEEFDHSHVVSALGVVASYPGFSNDPLDGYRHLVGDLDGPLSPVLGNESETVLAQARQWQSPKRTLP